MRRTRWKRMWSRQYASAEGVAHRCSARDRRQESDLVSGSDRRGTGRTLAVHDHRAHGRDLTEAFAVARREDIDHVPGALPLGLDLGGARELSERGEEPHPDHRHRRSRVPRPMPNRYRAEEDPTMPFLALLSDRSPE